MKFSRHICAVLVLLASACLAPADPPNYLPPGVTPAMEQTFLTRYLAAAKEKERNSFPALIANDPKIDPAAAAAFSEKLKSGAVRDLAATNPVYTFVPIPPEITKAETRPFKLQGRMYRPYLPSPLDLMIAYDVPASDKEPLFDASVHEFLSLCLQNGKLMINGLKEVPAAGASSRQVFK